MGSACSEKSMSLCCVALLRTNLWPLHQRTPSCFVLPVLIRAERGLLSLSRLRKTLNQIGRPLSRFVFAWYLWKGKSTLNSSSAQRLPTLPSACRDLFSLPFSWWQPAIPIALPAGWLLLLLLWLIDALNVPFLLVSADMY